MQLGDVWKDAFTIARETKGVVERIARESYVLDGAEYAVDVHVVITPKGASRTERTVVETVETAV